MLALLATLDDRCCMGLWGSGGPSGGFGCAWPNWAKCMLVLAVVMLLVSSLCTCVAASSNRSAAAAAAGCFCLGWCTECGRKGTAPIDCLSAWLDRDVLAPVQEVLTHMLSQPIRSVYSLFFLVCGCFLVSLFDRLSLPRGKYSPQSPKDCGVIIFARQCLGRAVLRVYPCSCT